MCTRATLLKTQGPWLEAEIKVEEQVFIVMDEISVDESVAPSVGEELKVDLCAQLDEDFTWKSLFAGNPEKLRKLEHLDGWRYQAYGEVISIKPVVVDCGIIQIPDVFHTNDPKVIGEFVAFPVSRLDAAIW